MLFLQIKIKGVEHEFSTIEGVVQDVTEIILNLKKIRFKQQIDSVESETATLKVSKSDSVTAVDIASSLSNFQVLNTDQLICEMDKSCNFEMEFTVKKGRGYVPAEDNIMMKHLLELLLLILSLHLLQMFIIMLIIIELDKKQILRN